ncbi:MAG: UTP--glucose-1-phosphate uridylyltransferase GalU [Gammaproteobacteria bacterium]|nr:UTP--glucose-1-phosphate uridylyltransferase GalU [Gammaproteobacteria bacterium]
MIRKCLLPVAGYGTRFLPATKAIPKEMLPILTKPLLQYAVEEAVEAGLTDIGFVTGRGKGAIEDHFDTSYELEHQIRGTDKAPALSGIRDLIAKSTFSYTRQREILGLGHAVLAGRPLIGDEPFGVMLPDDLCFGQGAGVMSQMLELFKEFRCSIIAVEEVPRDATGHCGVITGKPVSDRALRVTDMIEKPDPADAPTYEGIVLGIVGRYILTPDIFDIIKSTRPGKNGEVQITDALLEQAIDGRVIAYRFDGRRFDCGSVEGFVDATNFCYRENYA